MDKKLNCVDHCPDECPDGDRCGFTLLTIYIWNGQCPDKSPDHLKRTHKCSQERRLERSRSRERYITYGFKELSCPYGVPTLS